MFVHELVYAYIWHTSLCILQVVIETLSESDIVICDKAIIAPLDPDDHEVMVS